MINTLQNKVRFAKNHLFGMKRNNLNISEFCNFLLQKDYCCFCQLLYMCFLHISLDKLEYPINHIWVPDYRTFINFYIWKVFIISPQQEFFDQRLCILFLIFLSRIPYILQIDSFVVLLIPRLQQILMFLINAHLLFSSLLNHKKINSIIFVYCGICFLIMNFSWYLF